MNDSNPVKVNVILKSGFALFIGYHLPSPFIDSRSRLLCSKKRYNNKTVDWNGLYHVKWWSVASVSIFGHIS